MVRKGMLDLQNVNVINVRSCVLEWILNDVINVMVSFVENVGDGIHVNL